MNIYKIVWAFLGICSISHAVKIETPPDIINMSTADIINRYKSSKDDGKGEYFVGLKWYQGAGIQRSPAAARTYFIKAAEKGCAEAAYMLSIMYAGDQGIPKDNTQCLAYMRRAAELGDDEAQYVYATMLLKGVLIEPNVAEATIWLNKAAAQGYGEAFFTLGEFAQYGIDSSGNEVEPDYKKAVALFKQAADNKSYQGMLSLAQFYHLGLGVEKNKQEAKKLFTQILNSADKNSFFTIGSMYEKGIGVDKNLDKAKYYYKNSERLGFQDEVERINKKILKRDEKARQSEKASSSRTPQQADSGKQRASAYKKVKKKNKQEGKVKPEAASTTSLEDDNEEAPEISSEIDIDMPSEAVKKALNNAAEYDDKSFVFHVDINNNSLTIKNPFDDSMVTIIYEQHKSIQEKTKKLEKFTYDKRIKQWFGRNPLSLNQESIDRHRFAQRMDEIIQIYGVKGSFRKEDGTFETNKTVNGYITTKDNRVLEGTFEYAYYRDKDHRKILYHRFFNPNSQVTYT